MKTELTPGMEQAARPRHRWRTTLWLGGTVGVLLLLLIFVWSAMRMRTETAPTDVDYATTRLTDNGLFQVSYLAPAGSPPINQIHTWTLQVTTPDGRPVENATIAVDGDMPQHGHGLPTRPQVTQYLGDGQYLVEGIRFQMGGWWIMTFEITAGDRTDGVTFNLQLQR
jgi:hypothetical protein